MWINYLVMANLIFPTGTSDDDGGMLLEVHLRSWIHSVFTTYVVYQPDIFLLIKCMRVT